jgi:hypothetical protein
MTEANTNLLPLMLITLILGVFIGKTLQSDSNAKLEYGDSGLPKNCRTIIYENYKGYTSKDYTAEDVVESINRNCGKDGYSWPE